MFYKGNYKLESKEKGGWFVGWFMDNLRRSENLEIKYWDFKKGEEIEHPLKVQRNATEYTLIFKGRIKGRIRDQVMTLGEGEYIIINPGVVNNLVEKVLEDTKGLTIKVPSEENDTVKIEEEYYK